MSERGQFRGGRGGRGNRGDRSGERGSRGSHTQGNATDKKKENILDLSKYKEKEISVKFSGDREVIGILKGYDQLMNLVLDNVKEVMRGLYTRVKALPAVLTLSSDEDGNTSTRNLGLLVARGTLLVLISPTDGSEEIENPFLQADDDDE